MVAVVPARKMMPLTRFRRSVFSCAISVLPGVAKLLMPCEEIIFYGVPRQTTVFAP